MVDRDYELAPANQLRAYLTSDLGTDYFLPATKDSTEDKGVFHSALMQQPVKRGADGQGCTR